jgi:hypothetical protein
MVDQYRQVKTGLDELPWLTGGAAQQWTLLGEI